MSLVTDNEVGELESRLSNLIHSHTGEIAEQRYAFGKEKERGREERGERQRETDTGIHREERR